MKISTVYKNCGAILEWLIKLYCMFRYFEATFEKRNFISWGRKDCATRSGYSVAEMDHVDAAPALALQHCVYCELRYTVRCSQSKQMSASPFSNSKFNYFWEKLCKGFYCPCFFQ
jgi:hypothetical protein